jgi:hypothetical protein
MTDKYIHFTGSINADGTGIVDVPILIQDDGVKTGIGVFDVEASKGTTSVVKTPVAASLTSVTLLAANTNRKVGSIFTNRSNTATLYITLGTPATLNSARMLLPDATYVMDDISYTGVVTGIWNIADGQCNIEEAL